MHSEKPKISIVLSVYNEEKKIAQALKSVSGWADEIIVVDNNSGDSTVKIAAKYTRNIYHQDNNPMLNVNKNYGFSKASGDWIFSLDADEEIPDPLKSEINSILTDKNGPDAYWISRKNIIFGKWIRHGLWWPDRQLRLFRNGKGKFPCVHVHEYLSVDGKTGELNEFFLHHNYETISQFIRKMDLIYTENEVRNLTALNYRISWYDAFRFPVSDFIKVYFAQRAYLDGWHGLILSLLQAFYSFVVFAKLWEKQGFTESDIDFAAAGGEISKNMKDLRYWILSTRIEKENFLPVKIFLKFLRRIKVY